MAIQPARRRFTVAEYHQMGETGILGEDDRVELIDGEVTQMTPIGRRHAAGVIRLTALFTETFGREVAVSGQNPVVLDDYTEPQPDLALLRPKPDFYASGLPTPEDVLLLVEVAESTVDPDRRIKAPIYARSGIVEYWLLDLPQQTVSVYRDPSPGGYRTVQVLRRGEQIAPLAFPGRYFAVDTLLG